jgi:hypothetical protein
VFPLDSTAIFFGLPENSQKFRYIVEGLPEKSYFNNYFERIFQLMPRPIIPIVQK